MSAFVFKNCKNKFPGLTKEETIALIYEATGKVPTGEGGEAFITKIREQNKGISLSFWFGTRTEYNALTKLEENCHYIITDDFENFFEAVQEFNKRADEVDEKIAEVELKAGDVVETVRSDKGDRYLLCNGDVVPVGEYPALRTALPYNTEWRRFAQFDIEYTTVRPLPVAGQWALIETSRSTTSAGKTAVHYDANTDTTTEIALPSDDGNTGIFGLTHDGEKYVLGVDVGSSAIRLYTSSDLAAWALAYEITYTHYGRAYDMMFDGVDILVATVYYNTSSKYNTYVYAVNPAMTSHKTRISGSDYDDEHYFCQYPTGYWGFNTEDQTSIHVRKAGTTDDAFRLALAENNTYHTLAFFNDRYWMTVPPSDDVVTTYIAFCDLETGETPYISLYGFVKASTHAYFHGAEYDRNANVWKLYLHSNASNEPNMYYIGYISADSDPTVKDNYTFVRVEALPERIPCGQMHIDRTYYYEESTSKRYLKDPNQKHLPTHDGDAMKYIYTGDDL